MDKKQSNSVSQSGVPKAHVTQLLAAVSILGVSLGMSQAQAEPCASGQHCDVKPAGTTNFLKLDATRVKTSAPMDESSPKLGRDLHGWGTSNQIKYQSIGSSTGGSGAGKITHDTVSTPGGGRPPQ